MRRWKPSEVALEAFVVVLMISLSVIVMRGALLLIGGW